MMHPKYLSYLVVGFIIIASFLSINITGWGILSNDFFGLLRLTEYFELSEISTHYNGIFPPGYIALVDILGKLKGHILISLISVNCIIGLAFSLSLYNVSEKHYHLSEKNSLFLLAMVGFLDPNLFRYLISPVPSYLFVVLNFAALTLLFFRGNESQKLRFAGFFLLCLSLTFRYHAIVLISILMVFFLVQKKNSRAISLSIILLPFLLYLLGISYAYNGTFFTSDHKIFVNNVNWFEVKPNYQFEQLSLIAFLKFYIFNFSRHSTYALCLFLPLIFKNIYSNKIRNLSVILILYYFIIKLHPSPRGFLLIIPFSYLNALVFIQWITPSIQKKLKSANKIMVASLIVGILIISIQFLRETKYTLLNLEKQKTEKYKIIEQELSKAKVPLKSIFTNDYDLYFPDSIPNQIYKNGGWSKLYPPIYNDFPNIDFKNSSSLIKDLQNYNIKYLLINKKLLQEQFSAADFASFQAVLKSKNFKLIKEISDIEIIKVPY